MGNPKDMKTNLIVDSEDKVTPLAIEDGLTKVSPAVYYLSQEVEF